MLLSKNTKNLALSIAREKIQFNLFSNRTNYSLLDFQYKMFASILIFNLIEKVMKLPKLGDSISDATIVKMHKSKI